jgi:hypothetical protein
MLIIGAPRPANRASGVFLGYSQGIPGARQVQHVAQAAVREPQAIHVWPLGIRDDGNDTQRRIFWPNFARYFSELQSLRDGCT